MIKNTNFINWDEIPVIIDVEKVEILLALKHNYIINNWKKIGLPFWKFGKSLRMNKEDLKAWIENNKARKKD